MPGSSLRGVDRSEAAPPNTPRLSDVTSDGVVHIRKIHDQPRPVW